MPEIQKKMVVYSDAEQSLDMIKNHVLSCFEHKGCRYTERHLKQQFIETTVNNGSPDFNQLRDAIKFCQEHEAALLITRALKGQGLLELLLLLQQSNLVSIFTHAGPLSPQVVDEVIKSEMTKRANISAGTKSGLANRAKEGAVLGNPNFEAIRNTDTAAANKQRQEQAYQDALALIAEIDKLPDEELYSHSNIAHQLNMKGITTRRGNRISRMTVGRAYKDKERYEQD